MNALHCLKIEIPLIKKLLARSKNISIGYFSATKNSRIISRQSNEKPNNQNNNHTNLWIPK